MPSNGHEPFSMAAVVDQLERTQTRLALNVSDDMQLNISQIAMAEYQRDTKMFTCVLEHRSQLKP